MRTRNVKLALLAAIALTAVAGCSSNDNDRPPDMPPQGNQAPTVSAIDNVTTNQDTVVGPLAFTVGDDSTAADMLTVTAAVDGSQPFPMDAVALGGSGAARTITLTPLESSMGTAVVTISAKDAQGLVTTRNFGIIVNARNASVRDAVVSTFDKADDDTPTPLNGFTFTQDADDPAAFAGLVGEE